MVTPLSRMSTNCAHLRQGRSEAQPFLTESRVPRARIPLIPSIYSRTVLKFGRPVCHASRWRRRQAEIGHGRQAERARLISGEVVSTDTCLWVVSRFDVGTVCQETRPTTTNPNRCTPVRNLRAARVVAAEATQALATAWPGSV